MLARFTGRVVDWFVMTDELLYERLAISAAHGHSLLPRVHGELIGNLNQLYPLLISPLFGDANVPASLHRAHVLNAFVISSAAVPVFLLARRVLRGRLWLPLAAAALSIAVPWVVLASFLLTEVAAYPAFCWAVLAVTRAVERQRASADLVAIAAIAVAMLARVQLVVLVGVLPLAVLVEALLVEAGRGARGRELVRSAVRQLVATRRFLVALSAAGVVLLVAVLAIGRASSLFGNYGVAVTGGGGSPLELVRLVAEHAAVVALTLGILPALVAITWAGAQLRPGAADEYRAFGIVAVLTVTALTVEVASFDQRFGTDLVKDRYLFYVVPVLLVALAAALTDVAWPRRVIAAPALVVAAGFAFHPLPVYDKLNADSLAALLNPALLELGGSDGLARATLAVAALVLALLYVQATLLLPRVAVVAVVAALTLVLPAQTVYAFHRLSEVPGTSGRLVTLDQGRVFDWIDRTVGPDAEVTIFPFPDYPGSQPGDYWAGVSYWWNVEFWNESVRSVATAGGTFSGTPDGSFPKIDLGFDPETGAASATGGRYLARVAGDARFGLASTRYVTSNDGIELLEPERPWRATWVSYDTWNDGWTKPYQPARVRVFAEPKQRTALVRYVTIGVQAPADAQPRPFTVATNRQTWADTAQPAAFVDKQLQICVPAGGHADATISTPTASTIYGNQATSVTRFEPRGGGVRFQVALADETTPVVACP